MEKKLYKSRHDVKIDGVCSGIAKYIGMDATLVRILWLAVVLLAGSGILAYIICAIIMPREPDIVDHTHVGYDKDPRAN